MPEKYDQWIGVRISNRERKILERKAEELGSSISVAFRAILNEWNQRLGLLGFAPRAGSITSDGSLSASLPDTPKGENLESLQASAPGCSRQASTALSRGMADCDAASGPDEGVIK